MQVQNGVLSYCANALMRFDQERPVAIVAGLQQISELVPRRLKNAKAQPPIDSEQQTSISAGSLVGRP